MARQAHQRLCPSSTSVPGPGRASGLHGQRLEMLGLQSRTASLPRNWQCAPWGGCEPRPRKTALVSPGQGGHEGRSAAQRAQPASKAAGAPGAGFMSSLCLGCTLLQSLEAQLGGRRRPLESALRARGWWPQKQLGLCWASRPGKRRHGTSLPAAKAPRPGLSPGLTSVPLHPPQSQGSLGRPALPTSFTCACRAGNSLPHRQPTSRYTVLGLPGG